MLCQTGAWLFYIGRLLHTYVDKWCGPPRVRASIPLYDPTPRAPATVTSLLRRNMPCTTRVFVNGDGQAHATGGISSIFHLVGFPTQRGLPKAVTEPAMKAWSRRSSGACCSRRTVAGEEFCWAQCFGSSPPATGFRRRGGRPGAVGVTLITQTQQSGF